MISLNFKLKIFVHIQYKRNKILGIKRKNLTAHKSLHHIFYHELCKLSNIQLLRIYVFSCLVFQSNNNEDHHTGYHQVHAYMTKWEIGAFQHL